MLPLFPVSACLMALALSAAGRPFEGHRREEQSEFGTCSYKDNSGEDKDECSIYYHVGDTTGGGTLDVDCKSDHKCYVSKCIDGWEPDDDKRNCVGPDKSLNYCSNGKIIGSGGCVCPSGWKLTDDGTGCWQENPPQPKDTYDGFCQFPPCS